MSRIVIVGAGHAAAQLCASLREGGHEGPITLVGEEPVLPYHRPPLSKAYVHQATAELMPIRAAAWYAGKAIELRLGVRALAIDRAERRVALDEGGTLAYDTLILATGSQPRRLPGLDDADNALLLRSVADADRLREALARVRALTVVGGGFIGLELAAAARATGHAVRVLEMAPRLLARSVSPTVSDHVAGLHRDAGLEIVLGARVEDFHCRDGRVTGLLVDGQAEPVELIVLGVGATPRVELAQAAGLACDNGIVVDEYMRTSDPAILAVGDCTSFPRAGARMRLESVQNANDQARTAAATAVGRLEPYAAVPWFWTEQGSMRLQIAGLVPDGSAGVIRPGKSPAQFSVLHLAEDGLLLAVETINSPADHMAARRLLAAGVRPDPAQATDPAVPLKDLLPG